MSAEERCRHLRYQLLGRVSLGAKPAREIPVKPRLCAGPVAQFMQSYGVEGLLVDKKALVGNGDEVLRWDVAGLIAAVHELRFGRFDKGFRALVADRLGQLLLFFRSREAVDLGDVEDAVRPPHRGPLFPVVLFLKQLLSKDDMRSFFTLAHRCAARLCLLVAHPFMGGVALGVRSSPKQRDIDAAIGPAGSRIVRHNTAAVARRLPRFYPWHGAGFHFLDDSVGNALIERVDVHANLL